MALNDIVSDLVARIKNANKANLYKLDAIHSNFSESILSVLREEGYIKDFATKEIRTGVKVIDIYLSYQNGSPSLVDIKRVSKPGRKVYYSVNDLKNKKHYNGLGIFVLSTSQGVMSDRKARHLNVGGEVICNVY